MVNKNFILFPILGNDSDAVRLHSCVSRKVLRITGISERVSEVNNIVDMFLSSPDDGDVIITIPPYLDVEDVVALLKGMLIKFTIC